MRVLVSGSSGLIGGGVVEHLSAQGDQVVRFDIADGHDVLDADDYAAAARGCDAIVHAAGGQRPDASDSGQRFITHNVTGNWNMLEAARDAGIGRVVTFSSVNALGVFRGEAVPDYLPIDDDHPIRPPTAYGMAKRLVEELCRCYTVTKGIATVCFRPPAVCGPARRARLCGGARGGSCGGVDALLGVRGVDRRARCGGRRVRGAATPRADAFDHAHRCR